jgi:hypothetical protein
MEKGTCSFEDGSVLNLEAKAAEGWEFSKWVIGSDEETETALEHIVNGDVEIKAVFTKVVPKPEPKPEPELEIKSEPDPEPKLEPDPEPEKKGKPETPPGLVGEPEVLGIPDDQSDPEELEEQ